MSNDKTVVAYAVMTFRGVEEGWGGHYGPYPTIEQAEACVGETGMTICILDGESTPMPVKYWNDGLGVWVEDPDILTTKVLFSRTNTDGAFLENLLGDIITDIETKTKMAKAEGCDGIVIHNNSKIIGLLHQCIEIQVNTLESLKDFKESK